MICPRCGTNIDDNATECEYCGLKFKIEKPQVMFEGNNGNWRETTAINPYTVSDLSDREEKTGKYVFVVCVCIIFAFIIGAAAYDYYGNYKLEKKYSDLTNKYGLTNKEIEDNISGFFYRTWYLYDDTLGDSGVATYTFTEDKLESELDGKKYTIDYKVTRISRTEEDNVFTIRALINDTYVSLVPCTKEDDYGNKLYDYIISYDTENEEVIFYDRSIEEISGADRIY